MFELDQEIIGNVKGAWATGNQGVQLPFDNVLFWWKRGGDERSDGVLKYGGLGRFVRERNGCCNRGCAF